MREKVNGLDRIYTILRGNLQGQNKTISSEWGKRTVWEGSVDWIMGQVMPLYRSLNDCLSEPGLGMRCGSTNDSPKSMSMQTYQWSACMDESTLEATGRGQS